MGKKHILRIGCLSILIVPVVLYAILLVFGIIVSTTRDFLNEDLIDYTKLLKPEMRRQEVEELIPLKYKKSEEVTQYSSHGMTKSFSDKNIYRAVVYDETPNGKLKATIFFDKNDLIIGIDYISRSD